MGEFSTGIMFGRDGKTVINDVNEFGQEWQVHDTDPQVFLFDREPQYPRECILPLETSKGQFAQGIALGLVLLLLAFSLNASLHYFQGKGQVIS